MTGSGTDRGNAAMDGGDPDLAALLERHRRELHVHSYRMLASFDEADDAVQETFLRAWSARRDDAVPVEITTFGPKLFAAFGLAPTLIP